MPRKPTEPFGHLAFARDGTVKKKITVLSDQKQEQEKEIASRFAASMSEITGQQFYVELLKEDDHDFCLVSRSDKIVVQATELVAQDYLRPLSLDDFRDGRHSFIEFVYESANKIYGVDQAAKNKALADKIRPKLLKYSKPKLTFWLLVWTVRADFLAFFSTDGKQQVSPAVGLARQELIATESSLFDEIWFFHPEIKPGRIWPI